jgi:hypothetical protein
MPRQGTLAFAAVLAAGIAALAVLAVVSDRPEAFTLGVRADGVVAKLRPGDEVCQRPIDVVERFDRLRLQLGTKGRAGPPYAVVVRPAGAGPPLARATVAGGYGGASARSVPLSRAVPSGGDVAVCIHTTASQPLAVYGSSDISNRTSTSYLNGRSASADLMVVFERSDPKSELELLPAIVRRAALFHGGWASTAAYWALLVLLVAVLATLPALALRSALVREPATLRRRWED